MLTLRSTVQWAAVTVWGAAVLGGMAYALVYENTPSEVEAASGHWPQGSSCRLASDGMTLVMFVHPRCPCTRASLEELAVLMTRCRKQIEAQVLFVKPATVDVDWTQTDLWSSAKNIPGVAVRIDPEGIEQDRFGARTSGETFAYQADGQLVFHGGITAGRGHVGDNVGRLSLEAILQQSTPAADTPVFGCQLSNPCPDTSP